MEKTIATLSAILCLLTIWAMAGCEMKPDQDINCKCVCHKLDDEKFRTLCDCNSPHYTELELDSILTRKINGGLE